MSRSFAKKWDQRIERARELAAKHDFAAEALRFYERIAGFQKSLYAGLEPGSGSLRDGLELPLLLPWFPLYLSLIADIGSEEHTSDSSHTSKSRMPSSA